MSGPYAPGYIYHIPGTGDGSGGGDGSPKSPIIDNNFELVVDNNGDALYQVEAE